MNDIRLTFRDKDFWGWLLNPEPSSGTTRYLSRIAKNQIEAGYVLDLLKEDQYDRQSSEIFEKLSYYMPRQYFLEVDFCAYTYATIFSQVFPPLMARVGELAYTEWLLYTEPDILRYRDHLVHMFKVAYVGDQLLSIDDLKANLTSSQFQCSHFDKWCRDRVLNLSSFNQDDKNEIMDLAFFFAALFHDFGYGYFFHRKYKGRLFRLYEWLLPGSDLTDSTSRGVQLMLRSLACAFVKHNHAWFNLSERIKASQTLQRSVVSGFLHDCLPLNHGIASTFFIVDITEKLWAAKAINSKLYIALHLAAEAAMIHDMKNQDTWAHLSPKKQNHFLDTDCHNHVPLALLLIFADELASWRRYQLRAEPKGDKVTYSMDSSNIPEEIALIVSNDSITVQPLHPQSHDLAKDPVAHAFSNDLEFLRKRKNDKHLNIMGYKVYVKPRYF